MSLHVIRLRCKAKHFVAFYFNFIADDGPNLPTNNTEEFRPFIRRLPEFKFWYSGTRALLIAIFCTFFNIFNVPVFWPILVMYFIILFTITMKRQIKVIFLSEKPGFPSSSSHNQ